MCLCTVTSLVLVRRVCVSFYGSVYCYITGSGPLTSEATVALGRGQVMACCAPLPYPQCWAGGGVTCSDCCCYGHAHRM